MPYALMVPDNYGYVALVALGAIPLLSFVQGSVVGRLRKPAKVPYPNAYASIEQTKNDRAAYKFNCAQRAHANLLENLPSTLATLLFSGLFYPNAAAAMGAGWVFFRGLYAYGYITSEKDGKGRSIGGGFWLMQLGLMGCSIAGAIKLL